MNQPLVEVDGLSLRVSLAGQSIVRDVSFRIGAGEIVGIVGESGSGKTMVARSLMGLQPPAIAVSGGDIRFEGRSLRSLSARELRALRGARLGMVFQEPMTSLNPSMTIGRQLEEPLRLHTRLNAAARRGRILDILRRVGIHDPEGALTAFPHQFSGGMRQRIMLASAMLLRPSLLIADEPTTALDALVQREVLELMLEMVRGESTALLMISHDLPMVARYCDRIIVMRQGEIVEQGPVEEIISRPKHAYTRELLHSMPVRGPARAIAPTLEPVVEVRGLAVEYRVNAGLLARKAVKKALHGVDLAVRPGEIVALVGASGSGKTTLGRCIAGLVPASAGRILFGGEEIKPGSAAWRNYRLNCQMIFQDPFGSLDPRMKIADLVGEALRHERETTAAGKAERVRAILDEVGLDGRYLDRYPHELSGGQRQRVAIARAVIGRPRFVIADEAVSALDVTVRAKVLELIADLQRRYGFSCLFISHDLGVVEQLADRVVVMRDGAIVEEGSRDAVFDAPRSAYTRALLSAIPTLIRTETGVSLNWRFAAEAGAPAAALQ
ncbi:ABC transporter ATP-binding protein [Shinella yambaruensis]|uniref:Peptide ABC transporter ATP-binding protein n=1 Tax=Shinella yambaruensis TaxID=415996 RepID=A0ABQ5ZSC7_9HYPH|nr:ABC transporter ATP-binding protein [Shinella yambaruensis]MCJ8027667.1 ABC transporter ATP-binding protein [Shinella yambaruensis]MCU7983117.1 ABC transporter ATP-binding protein [Shinella yambaruensis]GLR54634.1 peptide ABC transporter ATP-binding protein [Shinella yambaruensis]